MEIDLVLEENIYNRKINELQKKKDKFLNSKYHDTQFITNFRKDRKEIFEKAIKEYGDKNLFIDNGYTLIDCDKKDNFYPSDEVLGLYRCNISTYQNRDLSQFWKIVDKIEGK